MSTFEKQLSRYAKLAVQVGVNIQPNQYLYISASTETAEFVRLVTENAYDAGARQVFVDWSDDTVSRLRFEKAPADSFSEFPEWKVMEREQLAEKGAAFMSIVSQSPDLLNGIDSTRIGDSQKATGIALDKYRQYVQSDKISWTVIAAPSKAWAAKVFPDLSEEEQVTALWTAIFKAVRTDKQDPVQEWVNHDNNLHAKVDYLNEKDIANFIIKRLALTLSLNCQKATYGAELVASMKRDTLSWRICQRKKYSLFL